MEIVLSLPPVKLIFLQHIKICMYILQDCFFVSVIVRNYPALVDKPAAVCHSDNPKGTAEISSANYPARNYGMILF